MTRSLERKLEESYENNIDYANEDEKLQAMCARCKKWKGDEHDYVKCKNEPCFICWLGLAYLEWEDSFTGSDLFI